MTYERKNIVKDITMCFALSVGEHGATEFLLYISGNRLREEQIWRRELGVWFQNVKVEMPVKHSQADKMQLDMSLESIKKPSVLELQILESVKLRETT